MNIALPRAINREAYRRIHLEYLRKLFEAGGASVSWLEQNTSIDDSKFYAVIDTLKVVFDFCDFSSEFSKQGTTPYFKFHYDSTNEAYGPSMMPFPPVSFYEWDRFLELRNKITYRAEGGVGFRQQPYGDAVQRRSNMLARLKSQYAGRALTEILPQEEYWKAIDSELVQVFVPGCRPGILDRGHLQCMAFGHCTISATISDRLPCDVLIPGEDYVVCADDYSDVFERVQWCADNRTECMQIGRNARDKFDRNCDPRKVVAYVGGMLQ